MPELPEVENIVQSLRKTILNKRIAKLESFRDDFFSCREKLEEIEGCVIKNIRRRGKWIIMDISSNNSLLLHLGMSGRLMFLEKDCQAPKYTLLKFVFEKSGALLYCDMRRFGKFMILPSPEVCECKALKSLGAEPLDSNFDVKLLSEMLSKSKRQIKDLLLDQNRIAGIGNIYAGEILFDSKINPFKPAYTLNTEEINRLHKSISKILNQAIAKGGSTISSYVNPVGEEGVFQLSHQVYGREGESCFICSTSIKREKQHGRSTFVCPQCQDYKK